MGADQQDLPSSVGRVASETDHPRGGPDHAQTGGDRRPAEGEGGDGHEGDDRQPPGEGGRGGQGRAGEADRKQTIKPKPLDSM